VEYATILDEYDVALKVGYDAYWSKSIEERETILAADRILNAIRVMSQHEAHEANKPKPK
jgi:hypothetical protein